MFKNRLLLALALVLALASVGCFARTVREEVSSAFTSNSVVQHFGGVVVYPLGERFTLNDTNPNNNGTNPDDGNRIDSWEGWLALSIVAVIFLVVGAVFCFMGYKLFKLIVAIIGFIGGFLVGVFLTFMVAGWVEPHPSSSDQSIIDWVALGVGILFGLILAFASWWFYMVGIFLVGGGTGVALAFYIYVVGYQKITSPDWLPDVLGAITAVILFVILGFLAIKLQKFMLILGSAAIGSFLVLFGPLLILEAAVNLAGHEWVFWLFFAGYAVIWIAGVLVQYRFTALEDWHEENEFNERRAFV